MCDTLMMPHNASWLPTINTIFCVDFRLVQKLLALPTIPESRDNNRVSLYDLSRMAKDISMILRPTPPPGIMGNSCTSACSFRVNDIISNKTNQKKMMLAMWNQVYLVELDGIREVIIIASGAGILLCLKQANTVYLGRMGWVIIVSPQYCLHIYARFLR